ncbi:MAG: hypothetical protein Q8S73_03580 [Deltaproteobacteria bacterium]|nr:hypothetical protein [Myxococcales bacterium]MDP3213160.1 hypothetical protein [Deltaproteobacteria bacterium]
MGKNLWRSAFTTTVSTTNAIANSNRKAILMISSLRAARRIVPFGLTLTAALFQQEAAAYLASIVPAVWTLALIAAASPEIGAAIIEAHTEKQNDWWSAFVSDDSKTPSEVRQELREMAKDRKSVSAIIYAANNLRSMISKEAAQALGYLTREYARGETRKPDRFFRGLCSVLCDAESEDVFAMRRLVTAAARSDLDNSADILFTTSRGETPRANIVKVMGNSVVHMVTEVTTIPMTDPDRIMHILTVHGVAKSETRNNSGSDAVIPVVAIPRADCLRIAAILSGVK